MKHITYLKHDYDIFIGLDVDKKSYSFTVKDHDIMNTSKRIPASPEYFYNYIRNNYSNKRVICAYETGPTGFGLHDYLKEQNVTCLVTSPLSIKKAVNEKVKNNRIDSENIARQLRAGELESIRVPNNAYRELRHLARTREIYVNNRKVTKQRIKSLLLHESLYSLIKEPDITWSQHYIKLLKELSCSPAVKNRMNMLLSDLEYNFRQIFNIYRTLKAFIKEHSEIEKHINHLCSIPGIGIVTSVTVLANIGDPANLRNVRELGGFTGLVPTEHSTGDNINHGSITHFGNSILRRMLIESAWIAIRNDTRLAQFYHRIRIKNSNKHGPRKAITAVARKLTQIIYCVLKEQRDYIPS